MEIDKIKKAWEIDISVIGMGDIHSPKVEPYIIVRGKKYRPKKDGEYFANSKILTQSDGSEWIFSNVMFSAFVCDGTQKIYYQNKKSEQKKNAAEANFIIDHWMDFQEQNFNETAEQTEWTIRPLNKCSICEARKVPGFRIRGYSESKSICAFCMMKGAAEWMASEKK